MESIWSGSAEGAFFNSEYFFRNRKLLSAEFENNSKSATAYYIISVDVGRKKCATVVCIFKVAPQPQGAAIKSLVNIYEIFDEHFEDQTIFLKQLYYKYKAKGMVIDGNGPGIGLIDYIVKSQITKEGDVLPDFGIINDNDGEYRRYRTNVTELDAVYVMKANAPINSECYSYAQEQIRSGKVKFLIDERAAREKLLTTVKGQKMTTDARANYLKPFTLTSILNEEMNFVIIVSSIIKFPNCGNALRALNTKQQQ